MGLCWAVMNGPLLERILERDGRGLLELIQALPLETEALQRTQGGFVGGARSSP